jgi:hypothetical protein
MDGYILRPYRFQDSMKSKNLDKKMCRKCSWIILVFSRKKRKKNGAVTKRKRKCKNKRGGKRKCKRKEEAGKKG